MMLTAFGTGIADEMDLRNLDIINRYHDNADVDGRILALLLTFFYRFLRPLLKMAIFILRFVI